MTYLACGCLLAACRLLPEKKRINMFENVRLHVLDIVQITKKIDQC